MARRSYTTGSLEDLLAGRALAIAPGKNTWQGREYDTPGAPVRQGGNERGNNSAYENTLLRNREYAAKAADPLYIGAAKRLGINSIDKPEEIARIEDFIKGGGMLAPPAPPQAPAPDPDPGPGELTDPVEDSLAAVIRAQIAANQEQQRLYEGLMKDMLARQNASAALTGAKSPYTVTVNGAQQDASAQAAQRSLEIRRTLASGTVQRKPAQQRLAIASPGTGLNLSL